MKEVIEKSINKLEKWIEENDYKGYEPFDGLSSGFFPLTFGNLLLERILQQLVRQSPVNVRPFFGVKLLYSTKRKGYIAIASGYLKKFRLTDNQEYRDKAIELCFEENKYELGMDHYEVRKFAGWHHHMLTCMLCHFFLWHLKIRPGKKTLSITLSQLRVLIIVILSMKRHTLETLIDQIVWVQNQNHIRKQLGYIGRNLKTLEKQSQQSSLTTLTRKQYKNLLVIHEVFRQQKAMFENRENRIADRIVSISQPHVRPIKRGKARAATEFGAKISASLVDGFAFVDHISWDNYNEAGDLKQQIESYHNRFGFYPESVHADKIYRNRDNRKFCKKHGIRLSGPALGRLPKQIDNQRKIQARQDELDRIPIEGKFGQAKRRFSLSKIMCKLAQTSETAIGVTFIVLNIERWLKAILFYLFFRRKFDYLVKSQNSQVYIL